MRRITLFLAVSVLLIAACGNESAPDQDSQEPAAEAQGIVVDASDSDLGEILTDGDGNTLYMFVPDEKANGDPTCYDDCAEAWPALEATGEPTAGSAVDESLLGTVERTDGTEQVTYNDLPLYYFSGDEASGDTNGQGLSDVWWVVSADGEPIMEAAEKADEKKEDDGGLSRDDY